MLSQVAASVPRGVKFSSLDYDGKERLIIEGSSSNDQNILKLIRNLNDKKLISQATLATMSSVNSKEDNNNLKGFKNYFKIRTKLIMDLNNIKIDNLKEKIDDLKEKILKAEKPTLIKFGIGFGALILLLVAYLTIIKPIIDKKKMINEDQILKLDEILKIQKRY